MINRDIIYRVWIPETQEWFCNYRASGGYCGCYDTVRSAKMSVTRFIGKKPYEIWKLYAGLNPLDYFAPEKIFERI